MSATLVHVIHSNGDVRLFGRANNAWGSAPLIWEAVEEASGHPGIMRRSVSEKETEGFWALYNSGKIDASRLRVPLHAPPHIDESALLNALFGYTFDHSWVRIENAHRLVAALDWFDQIVVRPRNRARTCFEVARILDRVDVSGRSGLRSPPVSEVPGARGFCFSMTTVSDDTWVIRGPGEDEQRPYNFDSDAGRFELTELFAGRPVADEHSEKEPKQ